MRTTRTVLTLATVVCTAIVALPSDVRAQWPITTLKNVTTLPSDITPRALVDTMRAFTRALGVRCTYCHVGEEGADLSTYDFASDEKPEKVKTRVMLQMVTAINAQHLSRLAGRRSPSIAVQCATCHRGVTQPRSLQDVLLIAYEAGGVDSLSRLYRGLRTRYYGRAVYDFGEVPLSNVADELTARKKLSDAVTVHLLNVETSPTSTFAHWMAGAAQVAAGDTAAAILTLRKAVALSPNNQGALSLLKRLEQKR